MRLSGLIFTLCFFNLSYFQQKQSGNEEEWILSILSQMSPRYLLRIYMDRTCKYFEIQTNIYPLRFAEMGSDILNSKVAPLAEKALTALNLGKRAFKFTKIQLGSVKPKFSNIRSSNIVVENLSNKKQLQDSQEEP